MATDGAGELLATHPRSTRRGAWIIEPAHWDGLPDGHTRGTVIGLPHLDRPELPCDEDPSDPAPLAALLAHRRGAAVEVTRRPLAD